MPCEVDVPGTVHGSSHGSIVLLVFRNQRKSVTSCSMTFTQRDWLFAIKIALAALLALGIAFWVDLPRPYGAVASVYTVSQPLSGATTSKAAYRLYGTILGAIAAVVLVPNLVNIPELLCLALALWISGCLYFSLLDRTPRSYTLMLAGFTPAFVGFPPGTR